MAGVVIDIDSGAFGYLRHRFVRSISAGVLVMVALGLAALYWATLHVESYLSLGDVLLAIAIGAPIILVIYCTVIAIAVGVASAIHRRISALLLLIPSITVLAFMAPTFVAFLTGHTLGTGFGFVENASLAVMSLLGALIASEFVIWALWQLTANKDQFLAVRGWRAPPRRIFSVTRQSLGMPAFISNFGRGRFYLTFLYALMAVLNLGLIALFCAPFLAMGLVIPDYGDLPLYIAGFALLPVLNAVGLGPWLRRRAERRVSKVYQQVREWDGRAPIIFLRAFVQDAQRMPVRAIDRFAKFPAGCGEPRTIDELLLELGSPYGPVIAIGDPNDPVPPLGAARVFVPGENNEWQHVVHALIKAANAVIMCPSSSEGVRWELELISDALQRIRVAFLANPKLSREETMALFEKLAPPGTSLSMDDRLTPIAAYMGPGGEWRVLATRFPPCVQTYTVAINYLLQDLLGLQGVRPQRPRLRAPVGAARVPA